MAQRPEKVDKSPSSLINFGNPVNRPLSAYSLSVTIRILVLSMGHKSTAATAPATTEAMRKATPLLLGLSSPPNRAEKMGFATS
jgi:hypothetical protein